MPQEEKNHELHLQEGVDVHKMEKTGANVFSGHQLGQ